MEEYVKHILEEKAAEVSKYFDSVGFSHSYRLIDYGINFTLLHTENVNVLTISYSPKKKRWTPHSINEWVNDAVIPLVKPLLETSQSISRRGEPNTLPAQQEASFVERYFTKAHACLNALEPFAKENIDFSIIYDFAQRGVRLVLSDPRCTNVDHSALLKALEQPHQSDFHAAKEYLYQCLMLCQKTEN